MQSFSSLESLLKQVFNPNHWSILFFLFNYLIKWWWWQTNIQTKMKVFCSKKNDNSKSFKKVLNENEKKKFSSEKVNKFADKFKEK